MRLRVENDIENIAIIQPQKDAPYFFELCNCHNTATRVTRERKWVNLAFLDFEAVSITLGHDDKPNVDGSRD